MKFCRPLFFIIATTLLFPIAARAATILPVPFTTQAPQNQWRTQPFQDACEESSVLMVSAFYHDEQLTRASVHTKILDFVAYEKTYFGFHKDTNAGMTARMANERGNFLAHVINNVTADDIRTEIDAGHPVIFHAYVPALHNPHYRPPMNPYHVFVIIGYDDVTDEFITNDPGTNFGKNYRYKTKVLMAANHDWVPRKNVGQGEALVLFTEKIEL